MQYNAVIREYSDQSLKILARILVADLKDFPADWQIRYQTKPIDRESTNSIQDLCCGPANPLQIYKPLKNGFPISVRTLDDKQIEVFVIKSDTVKVLKLKIFQDNPSFPPPSQKLYICRQDRQFSLTDERNLESYGISSGTVLYIKSKPNLLIDYPVQKKLRAVDHERSYTLVTGDDVSCKEKDSPSWVKFSAGINLCGVCPNLDCVSKEAGFDGKVIINLIRYGNLQLNFADKTEKLLNCPACSSVPEDKGVNEDKTGKLVDIDDDGKVEKAEVVCHQIVPKSLIVSSARLLMRHKKIGEPGAWRVSLRSKGPGWQYASCKLEEDLRQVEISSVEPWRSPYNCVRCDTRIMFKAHEVHLSCRHVYHQWCMPSILKGIQCKACTAKVLIVGGMSDVFKVV